MKLTSLTFSILLSTLAFSIQKEEIPVQINGWNLIGIGLDSTIEEGYARINIKVFDSFKSTPIGNSKLYINDEFNGLTDANGVFKTLIKIGDTNFKITTPLDISLTKYQKLNNKNTYQYEIKINNSVKSIPFPSPNPIQIQPCKPVIYLYPKKKQNINVKVIPKDEFLFTYPKYPENGWDVVAYPNGKIEYKNRTYNYLFWEGISSAEYTIDKKKGFEVDSDTLIQFFENTLTKLGLTTEEQTDFITYWGPKLEENQLNFIHFEFTDECEKNIAQLKVDPQPDNFIRIFMTYHPIEELEYTETQIIPKYSRKGFTVVEWGGSQF